MRPNVGECGPVHASEAPEPMQILVRYPRRKQVVRNARRAVESALAELLECRCKCARCSAASASLAEAKKILGAGDAASKQAELVRDARRVAERALADLLACPCDCTRCSAASASLAEANKILAAGDAVAPRVVSARAARNTVTKPRGVAMRRSGGEVGLVPSPHAATSRRSPLCPYCGQGLLRPCAAVPAAGMPWHLLDADDELVGEARRKDQVEIGRQVRAWARGLCAESGESAEDKVLRELSELVTLEYLRRRRGRAPGGISNAPRVQPPTACAGEPCRRPSGRSRRDR